MRQNIILRTIYIITYICTSTCRVFFLFSDDQKTNVYFYAELSSSISLNKNSIVKFDVELVDEGNSFNSGDGIFVAPVAGVNMFSWTIQMNSNQNTNTELRVDNVVKGRQLTDMPTASYLGTTRLVLCDVKKGDHVWIQTASSYTDNNFLEIHCSRSSFLGLLIRGK